MTTPPLVGVLRRTLDALESARIPYAVLGGFAVRVWGIPRPTYDLDVAVGAGERDLPRILEVFRESGFEVPREHLRGFLDTLAGMRKFTVHRLERGHLWDVDVFLASTPFLRSAMRRVVRVEIEDRRSRLFAAEDVILLKLVAGRRKDLVDVEEILVVSGPLDLRRMERWAERLGVSRRLDRALREAGRR